MVIKYIREFQYIFRDTFHSEHPNTVFDMQTACVCVLSALSLLFIQFIAKTGNFIRFLQEISLSPTASFFKDFFMPSSNGNLISLIWFASFSFFFYLIFPVCIMRIFFGHTLKDYGLKLRGAFLYGNFYLIFMAVMIPVILLASTFPSFQNTYPFYHLPHDSSLWPNMFIWEMFYLLQFVGTEFFFRGFLIHGLKARFGYYAVFVSVIPYCMIHFQKPFLEAFASIIAGIILGTMSLRTNSVVMGIALHFGVALTMDICSLIMR